MAGAGSLAHAGDVCKPDQITEVELQVSPSGTVYVPATVNGHDVYFVLDFASGLPMVFDTAMQELGLAAKPRVGGAVMWWGGRKIDKYTSLGDLRVGRLQLLSRNAPVVPLRAGSAPATIAGKPLAGIMGSTLIQHVDAELYLAKRKLRLFNPIACRGGTPVYWGGKAAALPMHWDPAGTLVFIMELNGKRIEASLLSGARVSTIDANAAREFFGIEDGDASHGDFHPMSLTGADMEIRDAPVKLHPSSCKPTRYAPGYGAIGYARCVNAVPFNLGTDVLSQLRIYISNKQRTVFATRIAQPEAGADSGVAIESGR